MCETAIHAVKQGLIKKTRITNRTHQISILITFYHFLGNPWATDCRVGLLRYYQQEQYRQEAIKGETPNHCMTVVFGLRMTFESSQWQSCLIKPLGEMRPICLAARILLEVFVLLLIIVLKLVNRISGFVLWLLHKIIKYISVILFRCKKG